MKLWNNFKAGFQMAVKGSSWASAWMAGNEDSSSGGAVLSNGYEQSTWIYSCVNLIASKVAQTPFCLVTGNGKTEKDVTSGPVFEAFDQPHPMLNRFEFWESYVLWLMLRGEVFLLPIQDGRRLRLITLN